MLTYGNFRFRDDLELEKTPCLSVRTKYEERSCFSKYLFKDIFDLPQKGGTNFPGNQYI